VCALAVMTIMEFGAGDPAPDPKAVKVTYYYGKDGGRALKGQHVKEAEAYVVKDEFNKEIAAELQIGIAQLKKEIEERESVLEPKVDLQNTLESTIAKSISSNDKLWLEELRGHLPGFPDTAITKSVKSTEDGLIDSKLTEPKTQAIEIRNNAEQYVKGLKKELQRLEESQQLDIPALASPPSFGSPAGQNDLLRQKQLLNTVPGF